MPVAGHPLQRLPPDAATFRVTVERDKLPAWIVEDANLSRADVRRLEVVAGRPVQVLLLPDTECLLEIPAMRARVRGIPDRYQVTWFLPVEPGTYEMRITCSGEQHQGEIIVMPAEDA